MLKTNIDRRSIENLEKLTQFVDSIPTKIKMANSRAGVSASKEIKANLMKRGKPARAIQVNYIKYGEFGIRINITPGGTRGGNTGGRPKSGKYSILIASKIFLNAEEGRVGRVGFSLPERSRATRNVRGNKRVGWYVVSHTSGKREKGKPLRGPLNIPPIGPFYFSAKSGMGSEKITVMSRKIVRKYLNQYYSNALTRNAK